jgi:hypothetical protein
MTVLVVTLPDGARIGAVDISPATMVSSVAIT